MIKLLTKKWLVYRIVINLEGQMIFRSIRAAKWDLVLTGDLVLVLDLLGVWSPSNESRFNSKRKFEK